MRTRPPLNRRAAPVIPDLFEETCTVDAFAGFGGASTGTEAATGEPVSIAINHDPVAISVHALNHPETEHYTADVFSVDPVRACRGRRCRHFHLSPDCRDHSRAKGGAPVSASVRALADVGIVWAKAVQPDVITLENVPEFVDWGPLDENGKRIKSRLGEEFRRWCGELEALGYVIEWRILHAHHFGAPTSRKRLFLVARCDGEAIRWPEQTHGSPEEVAANPKLNLWRTAAECIDFSDLGRSIFGRKRDLADATLRRVATGFVDFVHDNPNPYVVTLRNNVRARGVDEPLTTVTAGGTHHGLVAPVLVQTSYGEREGQRPRVLDLHKPLGTVVAGGVKHSVASALIAPFIAKHYGGVVGHGVERPLGTVTTVDHHSLVDVVLAPEEIAAQYPNAVKVLPFITAYYGTGTGQRVDVPLRTITTRDRFALVCVIVDGATYVVVDITLRMLRPLELLRAQFGEFAEGLQFGEATSERDQVRLIGNSVVPHMQRAVVGCNVLPFKRPFNPPRRSRPSMRRAA